MKKVLSFAIFYLTQVGSAFFGLCWVRMSIFGRRYVLNKQFWSILANLWNRNFFEVYAVLGYLIRLPKPKSFRPNFGLDLEVERTPKYRTLNTSNIDTPNQGATDTVSVSVSADISVLPIWEMLIGIGYRYRPIRKPISVALPIYYKIGWTTIFNKKLIKFFKIS